MSNYFRMFINNMNRIINRQFRFNVDFTLNDTNIYRKKIQLEQCINNNKIFVKRNIKEEK